MSGLDAPQFVSGEPNANSGKSGRRGRLAGPKSSLPWFGSLGQLDFEIEFFGRLLELTSDAIEVLRVLAELVSRKWDVHRAVELDSRLVQLLPDDFLARYNLACSFALAGRADDAIDSLSRAILLGYDDLAHMEGDPDLESLYGNPDFQALLGEE